MSCVYGYLFGQKRKFRLKWFCDSSLKLSFESNLIINQLNINIFNPTLCPATGFILQIINLKKQW